MQAALGLNVLPALGGKPANMSEELPGRIRVRGDAHRHPSVSVPLQQRAWRVGDDMGGAGSVG